MDKQTFDKLVTSQEEISPSETSQLEELLATFPYCQAAHLLLAKDSHDKNSMHYPQKLRRASTYVLDRKILYRFITTSPTSTNVPPVAIPPSPPTNHTEEIHVEKEEKKSPIVSQTNISLLEELEENIKKARTNRAQIEHLLNDLPPKSTVAQKPSPIPPSPKTNQAPSHPFPPIIFTESRLGTEFRSEGETDILLAYLAHHHAHSQPNQAEVIENFLKKEPRISTPNPIAEHADKRDMSQPSIAPQLEIITENYAQILVKQHKFEKAQEVYRKLMLKYPDKSTYFAAKLTELASK